MTLTLDTLAVAQELRGGGFDPRQAETLAGVLGHAVSDANLATKADLEKLATKADLERFATKADLEKFATKVDLERFATKADLEKFATKADLEALRVETKAGLEALRVETKADLDAFRISTKADFAAADAKIDAMVALLRTEMKLIARDLIVRLGAMMVAIVGIALALARFLWP